MIEAHYRAHLCQVWNTHSHTDYSIKWNVFNSLFDTEALCGTLKFTFLPLLTLVTCVHRLSAKKQWWRGGSDCSALIFGIPAPCCYIWTSFDLAEHNLSSDWKWETGESKVWGSGPLRNPHLSAVWLGGWTVWLVSCGKMTCWHLTLAPRRRCLPSEDYWRENKSSKSPTVAPKPSQSVICPGALMLLHSCLKRSIVSQRQSKGHKM